MHDASCMIYTASCRMQDSSCIVHDGLCFMHDAFCILLFAFCIINYLFMMIQIAFTCDSYMMHRACWVLYDGSLMVLQVKLHDISCMMHDASETLKLSSCTSIPDECMICDAFIKLHDKWYWYMMHDAWCMMLNA